MLKRRRERGRRLPTRLAEAAEPDECERFSALLRCEPTGEMVTELGDVISYVVQVPFDVCFDRRVAAGSNFNSAAMCEYCRHPAPREPVYVGNVIRIFSACMRWNGCMVCGFCGAAIGDAIEDCRAVSGCPECGAVAFSAVSRFMDDGDDNVVQSRQIFSEWNRKMRCLDLFAVAAGLTVFIAHEQGDPLAEDDVEHLLYSALQATRLPKADDHINRFFDRLQETLREAGEGTEPACGPLRRVPSSESPAS
jgi:predicted  nucleic acid-binding Zn-ribbon protein